MAIGGKWQVSSNGGAFPRWRRDGKELFYLGPGSEFIVAKIEAHADTLSIGDTRPVFRKKTFVGGAPYDVSSDGQRFIVNSLGEEASTSLTLVENWLELLKNK